MRVLCRVLNLRVFDNWNEAIMTKLESLFLLLCEVWKGPWHFDRIVWKAFQLLVWESQSFCFRGLLQMVPQCPFACSPSLPRLIFSKISKNFITFKNFIDCKNSKKCFNAKRFYRQFLYLFGFFVPFPSFILQAQDYVLLGCGWYFLKASFLIFFNRFF